MRYLGAGLVLLIGAGALQAADQTPPADAATTARSTTAYEGNTWQVVRPGEQAGYNQRQTLLHRGRRIYDLYCVGCHGAKGDGHGPAAERLITRPRDFTSGIYKFRSTDSASLPMEADLHRTVTRGLSRVSMPAFPLMPEHDKVAVIQYIKAFYTAWDAEAPGRRLVAVPRAPRDLREPDRALRGRLVYLGAGCYSCHGTDGAGKGATQIRYVDAWGNAQRPFDFTRGRFKGGDDPEDVYRTFHTGLRSIMPGYGAQSMISINRAGIDAILDDSERGALAGQLTTFPADAETADRLSPAEQDDLVRRNSWDLVAYVLSMRPSNRRRAESEP